MNTIKVNDIEYRFRCVWALDHKPKSQMYRKAPALLLELYIEKKKGEIWEELNWEDFKGTYFAEKLCDYIKDIINKE